MSKFNQLFAVNVNDKLEKKGNQSYLSWAYSWSEVKNLCPDVNRHVYESENGCNYFTDGRTAWVKVGVTIEGLEHIDYLPIMDMRNNAIPVEKITSFDVNKAIQRSTTKAIAMHGLGLYVYAGEDMPEHELQQKKEQEQKKAAVAPELNVGDENWAKCLKFIVANKTKGSQFIIDQFAKKYTISAKTKRAIEEEVASHG